jgi:hypothetical protein
MEVRIEDGTRSIQQLQVLAVSEIGHSNGPRRTLAEKYHLKPEE